jgi:hypothetical protein
MNNFSTLGEITLAGRPDFQDHEFGVTYAKKFSPYVYSTDHNGSLIHKVSHVSLHWWKGNFDHMVRLRNPTVIAETVCGMSKFIQTGKRLSASMCAIPKPDAVLCKRCMGEASSTFPRKDPTSRERLKLAKVKLGCIAIAAQEGEGGR